MLNKEHIEKIHLLLRESAVPELNYDHVFSDIVSIIEMKVIAILVSRLSEGEIEIFRTEDEEALRAYFLHSKLPRFNPSDTDSIISEVISTYFQETGLPANSK